MLRLSFLLLAAVAVPFVISNSSTWKEDITKVFQGDSEPASSDLEEQSPLVEIARGTYTNSNDESTREATDALRPTTPMKSIHSLEEVLRFDISPEWVYRRWSRNSTAIAGSNLYGVRVPLVTGIQLNDVAGALTYYFNQDRTVERISLVGHTGDPRRLIALATRRFQMRSQPPSVGGEQLFQKRWNSHPVSELAIRPASVISHSDPHSNFSVSLDVQLPSAKGYLDSDNHKPLFGAKLPRTESERH